jgi:hypothetical protein
MLSSLIYSDMYRSLSRFRSCLSSLSMMFFSSFLMLLAIWLILFPRSIFIESMSNAFYSSFKRPRNFSFSSLKLTGGAPFARQPGGLAPKPKKSPKTSEIFSLLLLLLFDIFGLSTTANKSLVLTTFFVPLSVTTTVFLLPMEKSNFSSSFGSTEV